MIIVFARRMRHTPIPISLSRRRDGLVPRGVQKRERKRVQLRTAIPHSKLSKRVQIQLFASNVLWR